jgi:DNA-binding transcriptional LysR family regulator
MEAFRSVMITGGITTAAEAMHVTQPAVSRLIRDLEAVVKLALFERQGTRLVPTPEATLLFREVDRLYLGLDQIAQAAEDIKRHNNIVLRIGTVTSLMRPFLQQVLTDMLRDRADLPLVIDIENSRHIWEMVEMNRYDLGFAYSSPRMEGKRAVLLHNSNAVVAVRTDHELARSKQIQPATLANYRLLLPGRNTPVRLALERTFAEHEIVTATTIETSMLNCCHLAASGMGVAIVDHASIRASEEQLVAIPFLPKLPVSYFAIRPSGSPAHLLIEELIERMKSQMVDYAS